MKDLFKTPELIPADVQKVLDTFNEDADGYAELARINKEIRKLGYEFDYYLEAVPFDLHKI